MNDRIRARQVRVIHPDGRQLGIQPLPNALALAKQMELDLVEVGPNGDPPVCRIMDYSKFRFDEAAKARGARRRSAHRELKEMRLSVRIGPADLDTKTRKIAKFLSDGHKVRVTVRFRRGRELERPQFGRDLLARIVAAIDIAKVEAQPRLEGTMMSMLLAPSPSRGDRDR